MLSPPQRAPSAQADLLTIYEISRLLSSSFDLDRVLKSVLNLVAVHVGADRGVLWLLHDDVRLRVAAATGMTASEMTLGVVRPGEGAVGRTFRAGSPVVIPRIADEPLFLDITGARRRIGGDHIWFLGVPVQAGGNAIGVLTMDGPHGAQPAAFGAAIRFLSMVGNLVGQTLRLHQQVAVERDQLLEQTNRLAKRLPPPRGGDSVIGASPAMQAVFEQVHQVAPGRATVLIRGESGTGKEVIARAIHQLSARKDKPFVKVNCAALSETLLESELFGHEKGAFTGAVGERKGRFEQADGGTLFLDEIGDISPAFQVKLLRVLQEREFERVGGSRTLKVDVRLVCATNRDLEAAVRDNGFRADLYFRINVLSVNLPPLRERREDIPALVRHFLARFNADNGKSLKVGDAALRTFMHCHWPGNVRELENCVERAATVAGSSALTANDIACTRNACLSSQLWKFTKNQLNIPIVTAPVEPAVVVRPPPADGAAAPAEDEELFDETGGRLVARDKLIQALERCGWVQAKAARLLNLTPRQLGYAVRKHGIEVQKL
jgi:Nif-specific regulatory protein